MITLVCYYCGYELETLDGSPDRPRLTAKRVCPNCGAVLNGEPLLSHVTISVVRTPRRR